VVDIMKRFDLPVMNDGRKSFYGKAIVIEHDNGDIELQSYTTIVCRIKNGKFERLWDGYSSTTMRHINSFIDFYGIEGGGKSWWNNLECVGKQSNGNLTPTESLQIMYARRSTTA
jgi:hypothetical protein